jgi:hypothetical protein
MLTKILYFVLGAVVSGVVLWAVPTTCDAAIGGVQSAIEGGQSLFNSAMDAVSTGE